MTDTKHTPGPWFVPDQTYSRSLTVEVYDGVACPGSGGAMSYTTEICTLGWQGTPEWDATARLIAAAPDLLETLKRLEYWFDTEAEILAAMTPDVRADHVRQHQMIRAVIAKVKGE